VQEITTARTATPSRRLTDKRASFGSAIKRRLLFGDPFRIEAAQFDAALLGGG
jgi:hypothetical protein